MKVPQFMSYVGDEEYIAIESCFKRNWITEGPKAEEFHSQLLELTGAKYGVFAPNGTLAIYLGLRALGIGPGDEVIVPDFTFLGSASAVEMTGAKPIFADVNRTNFQIDLESADKVLTAETKAIMPVHIYGTSVEMDDVLQFSKKRGIQVIEDAAQAIGVSYKNKHAGTFGDVGTFSFFADKTITTGEGGFLTTNDQEIYTRLRYLRNQGRIERGSFIHPEIGYNFRITDLQAAIGIVQLSKLNEIKIKKQKIYEYYKERLGKIEGLHFFEPNPNADYIPFRVGLLVENATEIMSYLGEQNIETRSFFYPLHRQPCFHHLVKDIENIDEKFANSEYAYRCGICLPSFPGLEISQLEYVCSKLKKYFAG